MGVGMGPAWWPWELSWVVLVVLGMLWVFASQSAVELLLTVTCWSRATSVWFQSSPWLL